MDNSCSNHADRPSAGPPGECDVLRRRIEVSGRVQGVGFRPFVYRLATELALGGFVGNDPRGAFIEVEGPARHIEAFTTLLRRQLPPLAHISRLIAGDVPVRGQTDFRIEGSIGAGFQDAEITPDSAICDDCARELLDPADRRYRYPFINCTNCGPRYSIIQAVPYDRPNTTMAKFKMCTICRGEYDDPANRRFHAQPNACWVCGPRVWMVDADGYAVEGEPIQTAAGWLRQGKIVAIKGLGGFHLACRADDVSAVTLLRLRKGRETKPLAMMVASLSAADALAEVAPRAAEALTSPARPIVLMPKRPGAAVSCDVAPGCDTFGIMLPYTPLHLLLFAEGLGPLVMTSGNPSEEPLCSDNDEAIRRLGSIADALVLHDREIARRVDDSVVMLIEPGDDPITPSRVVPLRRARGYAPATIRVSAQAPEPILAVGGEMKSAVCLFTGHEAVVSEHLGELPSPATYRNFVATIEQFKLLLKAAPKLLACDLHPNYVATRYARGHSLPVVAVQHHHAHIVSCMADNDLQGQVIGVACDGTGYGTDGAVWGCEVLVCDEGQFERAAHMDYFPLPGGDSAARDTWRPAAGLGREAFGQDWRREMETMLRRVDQQVVALTEQRLASAAARLPLSSSLGRLFDAVAFWLGLCDRNSHEAAAAMAVEAAARRGRRAEPMEYTLIREDDGPTRIDVRPMVRRMVADASKGRAVEELALAFHETVAAMLADCVLRIAGETQLSRVALSGGCFANRLLTGRLWQLLHAAGLEVFTHRQVPPGDGGLALGQALAAAEQTQHHQAIGANSYKHKET
ncbi:MAG: carbamoyltransferase HypF [Planctomycetes bacterium]|nr:carbamoyltransferase HypF [Planctomycetota bacterium]